MTLLYAPLRLNARRSTSPVQIISDLDVILHEKSLADADSSAIMRGYKSNLGFGARMLCAVRHDDHEYSDATCHM